MANIEDYINYYKNESFADYPFNEMDNILFSYLSYIDYNNISKNGVPIKNINISYTDKKINSIFNMIKNTKRYKDVIISNYVNIHNESTQFRAITIRFNKSVYVSYMGTDNTIVGWRENFIMSYSFPVPAQKEAINYLNKAIKRSDKCVYIGGHSKGGNLAMSAYMYSNYWIKKKVKYVFNNDGPGFKDEEYNSKLYKDLELKLKMYIPSNSYVGIILNMPKNYKCVKTKYNGIKCHFLENWECFGSFLVEEKLSKTSSKLHEKTLELVKKYSYNEMENIILTFFDILENNNIKSTDDLKKININILKDIFNSSKNISKETKSLYFDLIKSLFIKE